MSFKTRIAHILSDAAEGPAAEPERVFSYEIYPDIVSDGEHEFDDAVIWFGKPGWQWTIYDRTDGWPRVHAAGDGFNTRDAALVDLLAYIKGMKNGAFNESEQSISEPE